MEKTLVKKYNKILPLKDLRENEMNAQVMTAPEYQGLVNSIRSKGFLLDDPVVWEREPGQYQIISGHHRIRGSLDAGLVELNCKVLVGITEEMADILTIEANRRRGHLDDKLLNEYIKSMQDKYDIAFDYIAENTGIRIDEIIREPERELVDDDYIPDIDNVVSKTGDVYILGRHRILCGDATIAEDVVILLEGIQVDLLFTDPPYGIDVIKLDEENHDKKKKMIHGGGMAKTKNNHYRVFKNDSDTETSKKAVEISAMFCENKIIFGGNYFTDFLPPSRGWIVWDKENGSNGFADAELAWTSYDKSIRIYSYRWHGMVRKGNRSEELNGRVHPTQKPVGLFKQIISEYAPDTKTIYDPFLGSGSTLIAAEICDRTLYGMEIDPYYVDVIVKRYVEYMGTAEGCFLIRDGIKNEIQRGQV